MWSRSRLRSTRWKLTRLLSDHISGLLLVSKCFSYASYDRVAHSYKMLENYNMSALALMKAKAMPIAEQQASTVQAIKSEIARELGEVSEEAKEAARDYMRRKGINNACKLDLQAARAARY